MVTKTNTVKKVKSVALQPLYPRPINPIMDWAKDFIDFEQNDTKLAPPIEMQQTGLLKGQPWARVWHNYAFNNYSDYLKYLTGDFLEEFTDDVGTKRQIENFEPVGTIKQIDQSVRTTDGREIITDAIASQFWGGTWSWDGLTTGISSFKKTHLPTA